MPPPVSEERLPYRTLRLMTVPGPPRTRMAPPRPSSPPAVLSRMTLAMICGEESVLREKIPPPAPKAGVLPPALGAIARLPAIVFPVMIGAPVAT